MTKTSFAAALNEQVGNEFAAHQQYVAIAVHYDAETLPRLAAFFYRQAVEERNHAMMLTQYLLDADLEVATPGVAAPEASPTSSHRSSWRSPRRSGLPNRSALWRDKPREEGDYQGEQFLQWFIREQLEEVSTMSDLLRVVQRAQDNPLLVEEYLVREGVGDGGGDPTAPVAAGGAL